MDSGRMRLFVGFVWAVIGMIECRGLSRGRLATGLQNRSHRIKCWSNFRKFRSLVISVSGNNTAIYCIFHSGAIFFLALQAHCFQSVLQLFCTLRRCRIKI